MTNEILANHSNAPWALPADGFFRLKLVALSAMRFSYLVSTLSLPLAMSYGLTLSLSEVEFSVFFFALAMLLAMLIGVLCEFFCRKLEVGLSTFIAQELNSSMLSASLNSLRAGKRLPPEKTLQGRFRSLTQLSTITLDRYKVAYPSVAFLGVLTFVMLLVSWKLALLVCLAGAIAAFAETGFSERESSVEDAGLAGARVSAFLTAGVTGAGFFSFGLAEQNIRRQFVRLLKTQRRAIQKLNSNRLAQMLLSWSIVSVAIAIAVTYGMMLLQAGEISIGEFVLFGLLAFRIPGPLVALNHFVTSQKTISSRYESFLGFVQERKIFDDPISKPIVEAVSVQISNVSFSYDPHASCEHQVLQSVSADFQSGKWYLITGNPGVGKSTLLKVIAGELKPPCGFVSFLGPDGIKRLNRFKDVRLGWLSQEPNLLPNIGVAANIGLFSKHPSGPEAMRLSRYVGADQFIEKLEFGYQTEVSSVDQFSFGQRKLITLARALCGDPNVLLLDEPTAGLGLSALPVLERVKRDYPNVMVIMTGHDPSLAALADQCLKLENGNLSAV